jgi:hypothetical protein
MKLDLRLLRRPALPAGPKKKWATWTSCTHAVTRMMACVLSLHLKCYLIRWPPPKAVWFEVIDPQDLDGPVDTEMMQHTHSLQKQ